MKKDSHVSLDGTDTKFALARRVIGQLKDQLDALEALLGNEAPVEDLEARLQPPDQDFLSSYVDKRTVEGVFDGEYMIGEDGKKYLVPPNYASKSKLVEGDLLRLVIDGEGRFVFKQRGPIDRIRLVGSLTQDDQTQNWMAVAEGRKYRLLGAAVSYFKGEANDEIVILIPKGTPSKWAAVENVIKTTKEENW